MSLPRIGRLAGLVTLLACLMAAACARVAPPKPGLAQVVRLDGEAKVKRAGAPRWERAVPDIWLDPGDRLWVTVGSADIAFPSTGERQRLLAGAIL